ncbi:unnamed protein product [Ilex paraguariensis]|uniref:Pentatricopeptide repeat-containing protein n=1 Tax=Ilex paraguariensis TaxID=185542 RepID=A0ABC8T4F6_9AQUA
MTLATCSFFAKLLQYTHQKNLANGKSLHAQIIKTGSSSCIYISNNLVNFYAKSHLLTEAHLVFKEIEVKDIVSWNGLINGYSQLGTPKSSSSVMKLFKLMRKENTFPDAHTFAGYFSTASILMDTFCGQQAHSLAIKTACCSDVFANSSLLNMYCKCGLVCDARKVFDRMAERNSVSWAKCKSLDNALQMFELSSEKNSITWSAMITGYTQSGDGEKALKMFSDMHFSWMRPSEFTLVGVHNAYSNVGATVEGKQLHGYLRVNVI